MSFRIPSNRLSWLVQSVSTCLCTRPSATLVLACLILAASAQGQEAFDFGDGRHGSRVIGPGETNISTLYGQVRGGADSGIYNPADENAIPHFENLTISEGAVLTVSAFAGNPALPVNPRDGGVLRIKVSGTLLIHAGARIDVSGKGYRGGTQEGPAPGLIGQQGDSWGSQGQIANGNNRGGGGGGFGELPGQGNPGSGGGGGHLEPGQPGLAGENSPLGGRGGLSFDEAAAQAGALFLSDYAFPRFGSGGGRGGQTANFSSDTSLGGRGGGIIIIEAREIINLGAIRSNGATGGTDLSGAGGGAGGSIQIRSLSSSNGIVTVAGGAGGVSFINDNVGGAGGAGVSVWSVRHELEILIEGLGQVTRNPVQAQYIPNTSVVLTPIAEPGWIFARWEGDLTGITTPSTVVMNRNKTITAVFVERPVLQVQPGTQNVSAAGGSVSFQVSNTGEQSLSWIASVVSGADFIAISAGATGTRGQAITVTVAPNTTLTPRTGSIQVQSFDAQGGPTTVMVTQQAAVPVLEVTPTTQSVSADGGTVSFSIRNAGTGSLSWIASVREGEEFVSITSGGSGVNTGTLSVAATENSTLGARSATIRIEAANAAGSPIDVVITQASRQPRLVVAPLNRTLGAAAGNVIFEVDNAGQGTMNWTASIVQGANFLSIVSGASGVNNGQVSIQVSAYSGTDNRVGTLRIDAPSAIDSPRLVTVTQFAGDNLLRVAPVSQQMGFSGGTATITVDNGGAGTLSWIASVVSGADFVALSPPANGTDSGSVTVTVTPNTRALQRTARIRVEAAGASDSPQTVEIVQSGCELPDAPSLLNASPGTFLDRVTLIWNTVPGATHYEIYRGEEDNPQFAEFIATSATPEFVDMTAEIPDTEVVFPGCLQAGQIVVDFNVYYYRIRAVSACGSSDFSPGDAGYIGYPEDVNKSILVQDALPYPATASVAPGIAGNARLALQLSHPDGIDPASAWGEVVSELSGDAVLWTLESVDGDGSVWVYAESATGWSPGDILTLSAGAKTLNGEALAPVTKSFLVGAAKSAAIDGASPLPDGAVFTTFHGAVGMPWQLGPVTVYDEATQFWIPVPEGIDPDAVELFYASPESPQGLWFPAGNVTGWLADPAYSLRETANGWELGVTVNHGGIVQLGVLPEPEQVDSQEAGILSARYYGGEFVVLGVLLSLFALASRRRRA